MGISKPPLFSQKYMLSGFHQDSPQGIPLLLSLAIKKKKRERNTSQKLYKKKTYLSGFYVSFYSGFFRSCWDCLGTKQQQQGTRCRSPAYCWLCSVSILYNLCTLSDKKEQRKIKTKIPSRVSDLPSLKSLPLPNCLTLTFASVSLNVYRAICSSLIPKIIYIYFYIL
ncbi:Uncharacterized protein TCM_011167 [Theobroma cacao]|uniref:Uncharacterized protein n=1 Tax=Theobroma cacao TaxID=3641 RepID=A0A061E8F8_THECC|nr:Uncharacterized protein TCM_011167 [Theobroma cacao]